MSYCSQTDIEDVLTELGVTTNTDAGYPFDTTDTTLLARIILKAEAQFNYYALPKYTVAALTGNKWVTMVVAVFAACKIMARGAQEIPAQLEKDRLEFLQQLQEIRSGMGQIPLTEKEFEDIPAMSNLRIDVGRAVSKVRVEMPISAGRPESLKVRKPDRATEFENY